MRHVEDKPIRGRYKYVSIRENVSRCRARDKAAVNWPTIIRQVRKRNRLSQESFAVMLGTTQTTVSRWETGIQTPEIIYRERLMDMVRAADPVCSDRLFLANLRSSMHLKSLMNSDLVLVEYSDGLRVGLGNAIARVAGAHSSQLVPEYLWEEYRSYFANMLDPLGDIFSVRKVHPGFVRTDVLTCKTYSVVKFDSSRYIMCEDVPLPDSDTYPGEIVVTTFDDVLARDSLLEQCGKA